MMEGKKYMYIIQHRWEVLLLLLIFVDIIKTFFIYGLPHNILFSRRSTFKLSIITVSSSFNVKVSPANLLIFSIIV